MEATPKGRCVRFGIFEADLAARELYRQGRRVPLQGQPFRILSILLSRPGQIVSRDELQSELWPHGTHVDFSEGLDTALKKLRQALGDSAHNPTFIQTVPRRGYRLIASVTNGAEPLPDVALASSKERLVEGPSSSPPIAVFRFGWRTITILVLFSVIVVALVVWRLRPVKTSSGIHSVAVLPLENLSGDASQDYFADGMTDQLITNLGQIHSLRVISRASVMQYKGSRKPLPEIARELRVDAVVEGSVQRSTNHARITAQLVDGKTDAHLWARTFDRDLSDVLALEADVAQAVAGEIQVTLTPADVARLQGSHAISQKAHDAYLRGRYLWNTRSKEGLEQSISFYQEAIKEDPQYAAAYAGIADSYILLENNGHISASRANPEMRMAAMKAVTTDPNLADAHRVLADVWETEWNWAGAEEEYKHALQLNPGSARTHHWYAVLLANLKRYDEAVSEIRRAVDLEPLSARLQLTQSDIYYRAGRFDEALKILSSPIILSDDSTTRTVSGLIHVQKADFAKAIAQLHANVEADRCADNIAYLAYAYARAGRQEEALASFHELRQLSKDEYVEPGLMAMIWTGLGNNDRAIELLEEDYHRHASLVVSLGSDPVFGPLHSDPRFQALLRRIGLP